MGFKVGRFLGSIGRAALGQVPIVGPALQAVAQSRTARPALPQLVSYMQQGAGARQGPSVTVRGPQAGISRDSAYSYGPQFVVRSGESGKPQAGGGQVVAGAACPAGFRLNKSTYVTRGGGTSRWPLGLTVHEKGSTCVKRRRRNVANAKALRRAVSRLRGFAKLSLRVQRALGISGKRRGRARAALPAGTSVVNVD